MDSPPAAGGVPRPPHRLLRAFAFDPILSRDIDTHDVNQITVELPWEDGLRPGPVDDYIEVIDYDPASQAFYAPVDLNDGRLLAQDGHRPSEGNPQFHQQMVYAVARNTIRHFERALGRRALWSPRLVRKNRRLRDEFVERLRIYPHGLREANAYYSPVKKALLFGYFPASDARPGRNAPGETVFTCLSHDIVAHETSHALLDGLHRRFIEPTNVDVWALHEAFADIVALFLHFTHPKVLRHQIARTRGDLESQNLLGELAFQFGQAVGRYGALRSAIGGYDDVTGEWVPEEPDPDSLRETTEPHRRGAILVAAVFEAFLTIYKRRIADLLRIATGGTGILPPGELHPDLVERLSREASKTAGHVLTMCIRALDYCPPVDIDFGDYLRALITADFDMVQDDRYSYRLAVIESFRCRGICPKGVRNLSVESLLWHTPTATEQRAFSAVFKDPESVRGLVPDWGLSTDRRIIYEQAERSQAELHKWFTRPGAKRAARAAHLVLEKDEPGGYYRDRNGVPRLEIHSARPARRIGPDGQTVTELVIEMTQRRRGYYDRSVQDKVDRGKLKKIPKPDFIFRGGCTMLVDPETAEVKYCVYKRIKSKTRLERTRTHLTEDPAPSSRATYFGDPRKTYFRRLTAGRADPDEALTVEPFALLHRTGDEEVTT
jgi:hypothetical protein